MNKIFELRQEIQRILETLATRVYYYSAPEDASFPYIVFDFPNSIDSGALENFVLDIDGWDINQDTTVLITLMDTIDDELHKKNIVLDNLGFVLYRDSRQNLTDEDKRIRRKKYIYQARTYQKQYKL